MLSSSKLQALRRLGSATVYEAQGAIGALDSAMKPLDPRSRLAGPALTVETWPADNLMLHYALLKAKPGDVLVVDAKAFVEAGPWGDVLTAAAMKIGVAGLVINGAVRDAAMMAEAGFPVFCRGISIKGTTKQQAGRLNVPVCIAGVVIRPGDIVIGDRDGVVIVAHEAIDATLAAAERREAKENGFRAAINDGRMTVDLLELRATLARLDLE